MMRAASGGSYYYVFWPSAVNFHLWTLLIPASPRGRMAPERTVGVGLPHECFYLGRVWLFAQLDQGNLKIGRL